jgi:hypothetical protein
MLDIGLKAKTGRHMTFEKFTRPFPFHAYSQIKITVYTITHLSDDTEVLD